MQILKFLDLFFGAFINVLLYCYIVNKVFKNNKKIITKKNIKYIAIITFIIFIINIFNKYTFKIILTLPFVTYLIKNIFNVSYKKSIIYSVFSAFYMLIGELFIGVLIYFLPIDYTFIFNNILGTIVGNILVFFISYFIIKIKIIKKNLFKITNYFSKKKYIVELLILVCLFGIYGYKNIFNVNSILDILMNFISFFAFLILFYLLFKETSKNEEIIEQNNYLLKFLEKYEKELIEKRKIIHDYNNKLIIINAYINNPLKLKEYISEVIKEQKQQKNNSFIKNIDKLPLGIKGLIYYKISQLNNNIFISLNVKSSLKKFEKLPSKLNKDILTIIGVLLDNAIEAINNEKEKYINIEFLCENNKFLMIMSNSCTKKINLNEIIKPGFSTKGKNRGYGIPLIQEIIQKNERIFHKMLINNNEFINKLIIKL